MYTLKVLVTHSSVKIYQVGSFFAAQPSQAKDWGRKASLPHPARQVAEALALTDCVDCPGRTQRECWTAIQAKSYLTLGWQERHLPEHHLVLCRACRQRYYEVSCVHIAPLECKANSSNYPIAVYKPNEDFVDSTLGCTFKESFPSSNQPVCPHESAGWPGQHWLGAAAFAWRGWKSRPVWQFDKHPKPSKMPLFWRNLDGIR